MRAPHEYQPERDAPLLSAYVDGELDAADAALVEGWVAAHDEVRREVDRLRAFVTLTSRLRLRDAPPEAWEVFWRRSYNRGERRLGWILFIVGVAVVGGWAFGNAVASVLHRVHLPTVVKIGTGAVGAGLLILMVSVLRESWYARNHSRYKDVIR